MLADDSLKELYLLYSVQDLAKKFVLGQHNLDPLPDFIESMVRQALFPFLISQRIQPIIVGSVEKSKLG